MHHSGRDPNGRRSLCRAITAGLAGMLCLPAALYGQTEPGRYDAPASVGVRLGPVALAPTLTLANIGWDSNVFHRENGQEPASDFIATVRPEVQGWLRLGPARVQGRSAFDLVYFREHSSERSVDGDHEGRLHLPMARITPYVSGRWVSTRQRFGFEFDERTRRRDVSGAAGLDVRLGPLTTLDVTARRSRLEFTRTDGFRDPFVSEFYDHTSRGVAVALRQALTPLTTMAVMIDSHRDRFDLVPGRDSNSLGIAAGLEFKPFALLSGKASIGWRRVRLVAPGSSSFRGLVASVDLAHTLRGRTRLAVQAQRDMSYSAMRGQHAYLLSGVRGSITHMLGRGIDVGARTGRHRLSYGLFGFSGEPSPGENAVAFGSDRETLTEYAAELGYRVGPDTRLALEFVQYHRGSTVGRAREFERSRVGMSLNYRF